MPRRDETKRTTTEFARIREKKRERAVLAVMLAGVLLMLVGGLMRFVSVSQAAGEGVLLSSGDRAAAEATYEFNLDYAPYPSVSARFEDDVDADMFAPLTSAQLESRNAKAQQAVDDYERREADERQGSSGGMFQAQGEEKPKGIIVSFARGATDDDVAAVAESVNGHVVETLVEADDLIGRTVLIEPHGLSRPATIAHALENPMVLSCDYDSEMETEADGAATDEFVGQRWDYEYLRYEQAWQRSQTNGALTVAVIDSGFNLGHEDLRNLVVSPYSVETKSSSVHFGQEESLFNAHGTHVAGIVAAQAHNGIGVAGLSHNAAIMPVDAGSTLPSGDRVMSSSGIIQALDHIADCADDGGQPPVRVVVITCGVLVDAKSASAQSYRSGFDAVFAKLRRKGIIVCAAAGNDGYSGSERLVYPASLAARTPNVISVINTARGADGKVGKARASNSNPDGCAPADYPYQISAPGSDILSCYPYCDGQQSNNAYVRMSGTSMAAPQVAGLAALMLSAKPEMSPKEVRQAMIDTATDLGTQGPDSETGYGEIDPVAALDRVAPKKQEAAKLQATNPTDDGLVEQADDPAEEDDEVVADGQAAGNDASRQAQEQQKQEEGNAPAQDAEPTDGSEADGDAQPVEQPQPAPSVAPTETGGQQEQQDEQEASDTESKDQPEQPLGQEQREEVIAPTAPTQGTPVSEKAYDISVDPKSSSSAAKEASQRAEEQKSLDEASVWVGGVKYEEFEGSTTEYTITFPAESQLPAAPDVKDLPPSSGWKVEKVASQGDESGGETHTVTLRNSNDGSAQQYVFHYEREQAGGESAGSDGAGEPAQGAGAEAATPATGTASGTANPTQTGAKDARQTAADIAKSAGKLVQTGDGVAIVAGAALTIGSAGWLIASRRRRSA